MRNEKLSAARGNGTVTVNGASIYYACHGDSANPTLVLLHGNGEDSSVFTPQIKAFCDDYHVITLDSRGHGQSKSDNQRLRLDDMADDVAAVLDALALDAVHLVGFSDGGNVALLFALKYAQRLLSLTCVGANLKPAGMKPGTQLLVALGYAGLVLLSPFSCRARRKRCIVGLMAWQPRIKPQRLTSITTPALIVAGTKDMIKEKHTRLIAASLPDARLEFLDGDHFVMFKRAEAFNQLLQEFIATALRTAKKRGHHDES